MANNKIQVKIDKEVHKKLKQLQHFYGIKHERDVSFSEIIDDGMKHSFKQFDNQKIVRVD